jgi:hypothetical protein
MFNRFSNRRKNWRTVYLLGFVGATILIVITLFSRPQKPRAWQVDEMPIAFWAWQNQAPNQRDVLAAVDALSTRVLFIRAGQIDNEKSKLHRIRALQGRLPHGVELHLVYHATRPLLAQFEHVKTEDLAGVIAQTFQRDCQRALTEGAVVVGLQLDFDVPTRLLAHYGQLIRELRKQIKSNAQVSITGLPTWMSSGDLAKVLAEVSFWIPQCYGTMIPQRLDTVAPIASPRLITDWIERAGQLQRPFYAGLSAYGYAIHYSRDGELIEVRGDLDPALIANHARLELVERRPFEPNPKASEWRYIYRARNEVVIDGLAMRSGEFLLLDVPTMESLQVSLQTVRENGAKQMLGICLFRLPGGNDKTTLSLNEVACAINAEPPEPQIGIEITVKRGEGDQLSRLMITIKNNGQVSTQLGEGAMMLDVRLPERSLRSVTVDKNFSAEPFFDAQPCAERRANSLKIKTACFQVGASGQAVLEIEGDVPTSLRASIAMRISDDRQWRDERIIFIKR